MIVHHVASIGVQGTVISHSDIPLSATRRTISSIPKSPIHLGIIGLAALFLLLGGETVWAWGPVTHIALGKQILDQLGLLPAAVAAVIGRHAVAYLYGCVAADVVFAKRWSRVKQFCHHWSTAFGLLENAGDDQSKAFSYGYLSHLAADTVAHGKYVPRQMVVSTCTVNFGHLYWELRADNEAGDGPRALFADTLTHNHWNHDAALSNHLQDTFLPFDLNRAIFHRMNSLALNERFQRTISIWSRCSRWPLSPGVLSGYLGESSDRILSVLTDGKKSPLLREDPNGTSALMQVRVHRRQVKRLRVRGLPTEHRVREAAQALAPVALASR